VRAQAGIPLPAEVSTVNSVPTAAGLAEDWFKCEEAG